MGTETIFDFALCFLVILGGTGYILYKNKQKKQATDSNRRKIITLDLIFGALLATNLGVGPIGRIIIHIYGGNILLIGIIERLFFLLTILCAILYRMIKINYNFSQKEASKSGIISEYVIMLLFFALFFFGGIISLINLLQRNL